MHFTTYVRLSKKNEMGIACGSMGDKRRVYRVLVARPEGKSPLRRHRNRWEDNIKMDSQDVGRAHGFK
jgi:hypothetical protein